MSVEPEPLTYHRLRAPSRHGEALIAPATSSVAGLLQENLHRVGSSRFASLRDDARRELLHAATTHTAQYRNVDRATLDFRTMPILMSGHQPQLFHAGVWFKNFVLSSLAVEHRAIAVNLIVDNDTLRSPTIRVPTMLDGAPVIENVPFDASSEDIPFEERTLLDAAQFESFPYRVAETLRPWITGPLVATLWPHAREALRRNRRLGEAVAAARHVVEGEWGQSTLEVPLSVVYSQSSFRRFAHDLLCDLPAFARVYNESLAEYRQVNRVRSRSHPVPDLLTDEDWIEAPLWIWSATNPRRKRLLVRLRRDSLELSDRETIHEQLPTCIDAALDAWDSLERRGIKIRPRALTTTLYARLVLSDLFLHGIGGAKYDELTDAIIRRYFHVDPPGYLTVTATVELPLTIERTSREELLAAVREHREVRWHAERWLSASHDGAARSLVAQKASLLAQIPERGEKREWHARVADVNLAMQPLVEKQKSEIDSHAKQLEEQYRRNRMLSSREFSFCLFPPQFLRDLLLDLSQRKT